MGMLRTRRGQAAGFTLIELMIVVAIIAILAAIAIPSYSNYITRSKLTDAQNNLSAYRVAMEQYYQDNRQYGSGGNCGITPSNTKYFTYSCALTTVNSLPGYTFTATGISGTQTNGFAFTIDQNNTHATTGANGWYTGTMGNCWVTAKGVCQ